MKTHFNNQGEEIDAPRPVAPAQSLEERMALRQPEPIVTGPLSDAHKKILSAPEGIDRRDFDYMIQSGQGMGAAFKACATKSLDDEVNELCKSFGVPFVKSAGQPFRTERDTLPTGEISVSEYDEDGRLLRGWITKDGEPPAQMRL